MMQALVFDLDDTLYLESDFVTSGYRAVAQFIEENYGCDYKQVFTTMMTIFVEHGRRAVFPTLLDRFLNSSVSLADLIDVYRRHSPKIRLFPGYFELLQRLAPQYRLGIITDGLPEVQERKVKILKLDKVVNKIIYTWKYGPEREKPHPFSFQLMLRHLDTDPVSTLFIGDNFEKDCRGAHRAGMKCAQLHSSVHSRQTSSGNEEIPDFFISSLYQLPQILQDEI
jgi:putative hydrolase of the HAD superfamily